MNYPRISRRIDKGESSGNWYMLNHEETRAEVEEKAQNLRATFYKCNQSDIHLDLPEWDSLKNSDRDFWRLFAILVYFPEENNHVGK